MQRNFNLEYYNFICTKHSTTLKLLECNFLKAATSSYLFNIRMKFDGKMSSQFSMRFLIDVIPKSKNNTIRFIESTFKGCDDLYVKYDISIIKFLTQEIRRAGNLPFDCSFKEVCFFLNTICFHYYSNIFLLLSSLEFFIWNS